MSAFEAARDVAEYLQGAIDTIGPAPEADARPEAADRDAAILDGYVALARHSFEKFEEAVRG